MKINSHTFPPDLVYANDSYYLMRNMHEGENLNNELTPIWWLKGTYKIWKKGYTLNLHTYPIALEIEKDGRQEERIIMWRYNKIIDLWK